MSIVTVTIPSPPICINNNITTSPSRLNWAPISTGDKPVTVKALGSNKRASIKVIGFYQYRVNKVR